MKVILKLNGVELEAMDIQPMNVELMGLKELAQRLKELKVLTRNDAFTERYEKANLLDEELEEYGLSLSFFEGDGNYCVYLKEEV